MLPPHMSRLQRVRRYFRTNPGALFVIVFQVLLVSAGVLLSIGNSSAAEEAAVYGFYSLVIGVAVYATQLIVEERRRTRTRGTSPSGSSSA